MKLSVIIFTFALLFAASAFAQSQPDLLKAALDSIGFTRADLGVHPKGFWGRFPTDIPYKLKSFDDLFAEPLKLFDFAKSFGGAVRKFCDPKILDSADTNLYNLTYFLGVERKTGGFRSYGANLVDPPDGDHPLLRAIENLFTSAGQKLEFVTFDKKVDSPNLKRDIETKIALLPDSVQLPMAELIENLREAQYWRDLAIRNVSESVRNEVFFIRDLSETQGDGMVYYPEIDDAAKAIDFESLCYAALKIAATSERAEKKLTLLLRKIPAGFALDIPTPYGRIVINGKESATTDATDCLLLVDFGGDDTYTGAAGATSRPDRGISVFIDLAGNDTYVNDDPKIPSCGAGILGVGLLYDASGSDRYKGKIFSQGAGFLGIGILFDKDGVDDYRAETSAQGAGYFGIGLCIDVSGNDNYYIYGDGQGMGGVGGGIGGIADFMGDDTYKAEPLASVVNRGDYHSEFKINGSNAQGTGFGRRGDGSDGHSWAGGIGAIVDIHGNDTYISGNWSLGSGYWFGTGICYDGDGDDQYNSVYFTQGSGAHFCNGILLDESGNDHHILTETAGAAFGFGWDYTNALLIDRAGNDTYDAKIISYGLSQIRSFAFFFDMGGDDSYTFGKNQPGFGAATYQDNFAKPTDLMTYYYYAKSAGIFIDGSGADKYLCRDSGAMTISEKLKDHAVWFNPAKTDSTYGHNNFGIGLDADSGRIPELEVFDR